MFSKITFTLGAAAAILAAVAASNAPARREATKMSLSTEAGHHATLHLSSARRSGYIVASS